MNIVIFSENNYGCGASIAAYRLAKGLSRDNRVLFVYERNKAKYKIFKDTKFDTWHLGESINKVKNTIFKSNIILSKITRSNLDRQFIFQLFIRKMRKIKPSIIHFHNTYFTHNQISKLSQEFPVIWTMHDQFAIYLYNYKINTFDGKIKTYCPINNWRKKFYNPEDLLGNNKANIIFTPPSQWLVEMSKKIIKDRKKIIAVPNGINTNDFFPVNRKEARKNIGISTYKFTLLFLAGTGAWERKNSIVIFEALKLIPDLDIQVIAIGSVSKYKVEDSRVIKKSATYSVEALRNLYSSADVFCIPSVLDNLPNTVLESLLCGTPVLGSNVGGIPEMIEDEKTGWLFDPYSAKDLAYKISVLYDKLDNIRNRNNLCRDSVLDRFSEETMVKNYTKMYKMIKENK